MRTSCSKTPSLWPRAMLVGLLALVGCAASPDRGVYLRLTDQKAGHVTLGSTSEDEVRSIFGDPDVIQGGDGGAQVLIYSRTTQDKTEYDLFPGSKVYDYSNETSHSAYLEITVKNGTVTNYVFVETLADDP